MRPLQSVGGAEGGQWGSIGLSPRAIFKPLGARATKPIPFLSKAKRPPLTPLDPPPAAFLFCWSRLSRFASWCIVGEVGRGLCSNLPRLQLWLGVRDIGSHSRSQPPAPWVFVVTLDAFNLEAEARNADQTAKEWYGGFVGEPARFNTVDAGDDGGNTGLR